MRVGDLLHNNRPQEKQEPIRTATKVSCDNCHKEIKIRPKIVKTINITGDIERTFFKCPHCKAEYTISYTDTTFRENIQKINSTMLELQNKKLSKDEVHKLIDIKDELVKANKAISQGYRNTYER